MEKARPSVMLLPVQLTPSSIPTTGVARASLKFGSGLTVPTIDPNNPPTITIGGQPATDVCQDALDPHILYFTVPAGTAGPADVTISGIVIPGMPWLSATPPQTMTLPAFALYTDDSVTGINGFSDSIGVSMCEAKSMATKQEQTDGLTGQPEADNYEGPLDFACNTQIGLIDDFMDGRSVDASVETAFSNLSAANLVKEQTNLTAFGMSYGGGATVPVATFSIAATTPQTQYGGAAGVFTITRTAQYNTAVTVNYTVTGTAVNGTDYSTLSGSVVIPAHYATTTINVTPLAALSATKTVTVALSTNASYQIVSPNNGTVTILAGHAGFMPKEKAFVEQNEFRLPMSLRDTLSMMAFGVTSSPTNPQLGASTFYSDVKAWMATNSKTVFFGNDGPTVFEVMNADNFALNTYYPTAAGQTVADAKSANPTAEIVLNGAFFGRIKSEAMITTGLVIKNGAVVTSVSAAPGSTSYTKLAAKRYWFGQMNDSSATRNAGHALSYEFGGKGNPVPGSGPTGLKSAIGGLVSLIWPNGSSVAQKQTVNVGDATYDADLSVYTFRHAGFLNGFGIIGVNRANGLVIVCGKLEWKNQSIFTIQDDLFASGTDQAIVNDGGGSTAFYGKTGGIDIKSWRHLPGTTKLVTPTVPARETVSNYFIFSPQ